MASSVVDFFADFRSALRASRFVELLVAFLVAGAVISFLSALINGFVYTPITTASSSGPFSNDNGILTFVIGGRVFEAAQVLTTAILLGIVGALAAALFNQCDADPWDSDQSRRCPNCLSDVPAEALVCAYCTRDLAPVRSH